MADAVAPTPAHVNGLHETPLWAGIAERRLSLQRCTHCDAMRYPPALVCPDCLGEGAVWQEVEGTGTILSWVVFHRGYLLAYPAPYNVIAVRLNEGPVLISNLEGEVPEGSWIDQRVRLSFITMPDGLNLPRFTLA